MKKRPITLLEIMIVIFLIGVVGSIVGVNIKKSLENNALSIMILHNHPSGDTTPSQNDRKITRRLLFACKEMDRNAAVADFSKKS